MKMVIVDDNPYVCRVLELLFEEFVANVETFESADQLLGSKTSTALSEFDVVLTDFQMPGTNGAQLARHLRQLRHDSMLIIMSGASQQIPSDIGAFATIIQKPFQMSSLVDHVMDKNCELDQGSR